MTQSSNAPSQWQQRIEGEWHGLPSIFDARGNHVGYNKVYRSSVFENGQTVYYMDTRLHDMTGPLHPRLEATKFAFGVIDSDYHTNPVTQASIEAFCATEQVNGRMPHALPEKHAGTWEGDLEVNGEDQHKQGVTHVKMRYRPLALLRAEMTVEMTGAIERTFTYTRFRNANLHTFDGPDVYGNGLSYGRALYTVQHFFGEALKIRGREFIIDDNYTMSAVWQVLRSDRLKHYLFGVLTWTPGELVLAARQR